MIALDLRAILFLKTVRHLLQKLLTSITFTPIVSEVRIVNKIAFTVEPFLNS